jgi:hypothetical protein
MPQGMRAMRTGDDNLLGDQSAWSTNGNASGSGGAPQGQGSLLGFKMAYMERVSAEVKRREAEKEEADDDDDDDVEITPEMLAMLTKEEKKGLRKFLVARLEQASSEKRFL